MSRFSGLSQQISTLLQNAGDTGDIGDRHEKSSLNNGLGVTKMRAVVSPNENGLVTGLKNFGDGKSASNQPLNRGVTNVTSVTSIFDKGFHGTLPAISGPVRAREGGTVEAAREFCDQYARTREVSQVDPTLTAEWRAGIEAFEQSIVTQVLDRATREGADLSADSIRQALRQNEDVLRQYPGVRDKLESIAIARDGLSRVEALPIGQLAKRDMTTKKAVDALFPSKPLPHSEVEIADTMGELAKRRPKVAEQLVRIHTESVFNSAAKDLQTGANQAGGAKFRTALVGNPQQEANLQAAIEALPNGHQRWQGFNRFLDIMEATGTRQGIGSRTAYNEQFLKEAGMGRLAGDTARIAANPTRVLQPLVDRYQQWRLGRNLGQLADILTDPRSANLLRGIASAPNRRAAEALALRLAVYTDASKPKPVNQAGK
jgi:hypothetical protein